LNTNKVNKVLSINQMFRGILLNFWNLNWFFLPAVLCHSPPRTGKYQVQPGKVHHFLLSQTSRLSGNISTFIRIYVLNRICQFSLYRSSIKWKIETQAWITVDPSGW